MVAWQIVERKWTVNLRRDEVRMRCSYQRRGRQVQEYTAQLEIYHTGVWQPVVRYDNAHGFNHCDIIHADGTHDKTAGLSSDAKLAFTLAIEELRTNWKSHRERFLKEIQT